MPAKKKTTRKPQERAITNWMGLPFRTTAARISVTPENALTCSAVKQAVYCISSSIASLPLILYQRQENDGRERATLHPLYSLLKSQPNTDTTKETFWQSFLVNLLLYGAGYAEIVRDGAGRVQGLYLIPSRLVQVQVSPNQSVAYKVNGTPINSEDLFTVLYMSVDGLTPLSPVHLGKEAIALAKRLEIFTGAWFGNYARPSIAIKHPGKLSEQAVTNIKNSFKTLYGNDNVGDVGVLQEGMELREFGSDNEKSQLRELKDWCVEEIGRAFGITQTKLFSLGRATWSNLQELNTDYIQSTLLPITKKIESEISSKLLTGAEQEEYFAEFLFDDLLKPKTLERYQVYQIATTTGILTIDEIRAMENRSPLPEEEIPEDETADDVDNPEEETQEAHRYQ
jgi:HK97 family phage portal protein